MARITIDILRSNIYSIAEGISVAISQHNGGTPSYEQLWASPDEARKLDIYYREAVGDLERNLMRWVSEAAAQFDLTKTGTDYTIILDMARFWPLKLQGLLANKIQDYLVHAVTSGWLNDFEGLSIKQDYKAIAANDINDIHLIICQRAFTFTEGLRQDDDDTKSDGRQGREAKLRHRDNTLDDAQHQKAHHRKHDSTMAKHDRPTDAAERRADDDKAISERHHEARSRCEDDEKEISELQRNAKGRRGDDTKSSIRKDREAKLRHRDNTLERRNRDAVTDRRADDDKALPEHQTDAKDRCEDERKSVVRHKRGVVHRHIDMAGKGRTQACDTDSRHKDDDRKHVARPRPFDGMRHRDNAIVDHHSDHTDWSGSDTARKPMTFGKLAVLNERGILVTSQSSRVAHGMGCRPEPQRPPLPQKKEPKAIITQGGMIDRPTKDLLDANNVGKVYSVQEGFFPTADFIEGASDIRMKPGTNIQVVDVGTPENPKYMFDLFEAPKEEDVFVDIDPDIVDNWFND